MRTLLVVLSILPLLLAQKTGKSTPSKWVLTFDDEFNGAELDLSRYNFDLILGGSHLYSPRADRTILQVDAERTE